MMTTKVIRILKTWRKNEFPSTVDAYEPFSTELSFAA